MENMAGFKEYQLRRGLLPGTIDTRAVQLRAFGGWLAPRGLLDATTADIEAFLGERKGRRDHPTLSDRSRHLWLSNLHAFYRWAIRDGRTDHDPTAAIERPRLRPGLPRPIVLDDLDLAVRQADHEMRAWLLLGALAGLRCAEIASLDRADVIEDDQLLHIMGKGRRPRLVPIHVAVWAALRAAGLPASGPVFTHPSGRPWAPAEVSRRGNGWLRHCGIDATMHQLRHRFLTDVVRATKDLRVAQELAGHSSPNTTAIYTAWSRTEARSAVEQLLAPDDRAA